MHSFIENGSALGIEALSSITFDHYHMEFGVCLWSEVPLLRLMNMIEERQR